MQQRIEHRTLIGGLLITIVLLTGISVYALVWPPPTDPINQRFETSLLSEMETIMNTVISDQRTITELKRQFELAKSSRPSFARPELPTYPAFQPRREQQSQWPVVNAALPYVEFPFQADLAAVKDRVTSVQTALASSDIKVDAAWKNVQILRRNLSDHAKMIRASNDKLSEIAALDQRRYIYFDLSKGKPVSVDELELLLKKADPKHNQFTMKLTADNESRIEKNMSIKQPIEIYVGKYPRACEVVVNTISHNRVSGYVSIRER